MSTRSNAMAAAIATCAVLFALPAAAIDGEILIDQARVNAGGITPGDAPGFPATLSRPGRYKLAGNLNVPVDKNGIAVTAHDVTIDFNGFTMSGGGQLIQPTIGVDARTVGGLQVANGTITGFKDYAIYIGGDRNVVEGMRLVFNGTAIYVAPGARIRNSTIVLNNRGIDCGSCLIEQNLVTQNTIGGVSEETGGVVHGNVVAGNDGFGLLDYTIDGKTGYGNSLLFGNNAGGAQVTGPALQLHPNVCKPPCP